MKILKVNDTIKLHGGYDYNPVLLKDPPNKDRIGKVIKSIPGQNKEPAFVVKLDFPITAKNVTGDILVMELRYEGQTWQTNGPVHLELCNFVPEDKQWKDRKQGTWIESHASFNVINMKPKTKIIMLVTGLVLPYLVGIIPTIIMSEKINDRKFYLSEQLREFDFQTGIATLIFFFLGLLLCIPWLKQLFSKIKKDVIFIGAFITILLVTIIVHFLAVFLLRFGIYILMGGIL